MPFQKEGIAFGVRNQGRVLIADEMGLGKTLQAIGVMLHFHQDFPALVVVPSSVKFSWATELERWTKLDPARIRMVRSRTDVEALRDADVVLLTYGMLSARAPVVEALQRAKLQVVVLDESHSIKSQNSQRNQLLSPILKQVCTCICVWCERK
jgi:SNF2 family DNA or RNA helicase